MVEGSSAGSTRPHWPRSSRRAGTTVSFRRSPDRSRPRIFFGWRRSGPTWRAFAARPAWAIGSAAAWMPNASAPSSAREGHPIAEPSGPITACRPVTGPEGCRRQDGMARALTVTVNLTRLESVGFRINAPKVVAELIDDEIIVINLETGHYYSLA